MLWLLACADPSPKPASAEDTGAREPADTDTHDDTTPHDSAPPDDTGTPDDTGHDTNPPDTGTAAPPPALAVLGELDLGGSLGGVVDVGDLDADGARDLAITGWAPDGDPGEAGANALWMGPLTDGGDPRFLVVRGESEGAWVDTDLCYGQLEPTADCQSGDRATVAGAGDLDGDGFTDLIVGSTGEDGADYDVGSLRVWYGPVTTLDTISGSDEAWLGTGTDERVDGLVGVADWDGPALLAATDAAEDDLRVIRPLGSGEHTVSDAGTLVVGYADAGSTEGRWARVTPDWDGDGVAELAFGQTIDSRGEAWVVSGPPGDAVDAADAIVSFRAADLHTYVTPFVTGIDDADGDGLADAAWCEWDDGSYSPGAKARAGVWGALPGGLGDGLGLATWTLTLASTSCSLVFVGDPAGDGRTVGLAPDEDGRYGELVVGAGEWDVSDATAFGPDGVSYLLGGEDWSGDGLDDAIGLALPRVVVVGLR